MRSLPAFLILISFATMSIFSVAFMGAPEHHTNGFSACVGSLTQGVACPENNPLETIGFHLGAFKFFSSSLINSAAVMYLAALLLAGFFVSALAAPKPNFALVSLFRIFETSFWPNQKEFYSWRSLHEHSPSNSS